MTQPSQGVNILVSWVFFQVTLTSSSGEEDVYRQEFGVRTVAVTKTQILINNQPFYCHGAAKHEDSNVSPLDAYVELVFHYFSFA